MRMHSLAVSRFSARGGDSLTRYARRTDRYVKADLHRLLASQTIPGGANLMWMSGYFCSQGRGDDPGHGEAH